MEHQLFEVTQAAIIKNNEGKILILQHPTGKWLLPGGRINKEEYWLDALKREVREETGIADIAIEHILEVDSFAGEDKAKYSVIFVVLVPNITDIKLSEEHIAYEWVSENTLDTYDFWHESIKNRIKKAFAL